MEDMQNENDDRVREEEPVRLSVMFNWNGHSWDAYEVLGIPPGSGLKLVEKAYEQEIARMDEESRAFIQSAYQAIVAEKGS